MDEIALTNTRVVAIDGGTATGKGRLIDELSRLMRVKGVPAIHLSTGSVYRAVSYLALQKVRTKGKSLDEMVAEVHTLSEATLLQLAYKHRVELHGGLTYMDGSPASIEEQLKSPGVGRVISYVSGFLVVRELVNVVSRRQINEFDGFVLLDGRDTTHVVVPDAPLKLFLTVSPEIAAKRSIDETMEEIVSRDAKDRAHKHGALKHPDDPGEGVIVLATDEHTPESVRDHVYKLMRQVWGGLPEL